MKRRSFKEIQLLLISAILAFTVTPFAILRLSEQQWAVAALDIGIVCVMVGLFLEVYYGRETRGPGTVIALIFIIAALGTIYLEGIGQVYWAYPALTAAFFLLETRLAVFVSAACMASIWVMLSGAVQPSIMFTVSLTLLTNSLFAYSFALTARRQRSTLKRLATVDPLTAAGNRRSQNEKLDRVNAMFRRSHLPASIVILDIDHFKKVNDVHGHITGDEILVEVAELIRANTRATESLYRYGGEEFIVIAENTNLEAASKLAENLRAQVERKIFCAGIHLTISLGVAELQPGEGRQGWLGRADAALFKAKGGGRNRVKLAPTKQFLARAARG